MGKSLIVLLFWLTVYLRRMHSFKLHSFLWINTLIHYVRISEQRCLMLVTYRYWLFFDDCVLKTGVITWPLKLYLRFYVFLRFKIQKKHDFLRFSSCCTRVLDHWRSVIKLWQFFDFSNTAAVPPYLICPFLLDAYLDHPRRNLRVSVSGFYRCTNRCSSFDTNNIIIFCAFGLKTRIHAPRIKC